LDGATVHVSIVGFDDGTEQNRTLDGLPAISINSDLTSDVDLSEGYILLENANIFISRCCFCAVSLTCLQESRRNDQEL